MSKRNFLSEITRRRMRHTEPLRISAFSARHKAIDEAFMRLLEAADPNDTTFDSELCRYFPIALVASVEGYYRQAVADLTNLGDPHRSRVQEVANRLPKSDIATAVTSGEVSLGDWYAHVSSFGSLDDVDRVFSHILGFPFIERLLTSEFRGLFEDDENFHLRESQQEFVTAAKELFQMRHILCHEFAPNVTLDIATVIRLLTVTDVLVALSDIVIFAEAEQHK